MTAITSLCLIQARMDSIRFPGKALASLGDRPVLEWVIKRIQKSSRVSRIVLATTTKSSDDPLCELAKLLGIDIFRGPELDVLGRFALALECYPADVVIRVCADNPFIWGSEIDSLLNDYERNPVDYIFNHRPLGDCDYADGFGAELFRSSVLNKLNHSVTDARIREHITLAFGLTSSFSISGMKGNKELSFPYLKFDLDTPEDFRNLSSLVLGANLGIDSTPEKIIRAALSRVIQEKLEFLFPMNRSLSGTNNRQMLAALQDISEIKIIEIPSGTQVYDWVVPPEWELQDAFIEDATQKRIVDIKDNALHVVSYSQACDVALEYSTLEEHLHIHPTNSDAIPYRTSYYKQDWGFCVTKQQLQLLKSAQEPLHAVIKSSFSKGSMTCGEILLKGSSDREIILSTYICHPAMANDSLSGVLLSAMLARHISTKQDRHWTYRIVFVPETIGALAYLQLNEATIEKIDFGLQITTVGGPGDFQIKKSWDSSHPINSIIERVLQKSGKPYTVRDFDIHGSDERQYSSPGFRINMATLAKDIYYSYPQYHTSLDNLNFVNGEQIMETLLLYMEIIDAIEARRIFVRTEPHGEPMLSRHGLYEIFGGALLPRAKFSQLDLVLWILFLSDGSKSSVDIARTLEVEPDDVLKTCELLVSRNVLREV